MEKEKVMTVRQMYKISSCFLLWKVSSKKTCIVNLVPQEPPYSPPLLKSRTFIVPRCSEIFITAHDVIKSVKMQLCCDEMMKIPKIAIIMLMLISVVMVITMTIMVR